MRRSKSPRTPKAEFVKRLTGWRGDARLFRVSPPVRFTDLEDRVRETSYVVVSATFAPFTGPETYIFPADERGEVLDWIELEGSFRGGLDHEKALSNAGYTTE